MGQEALDTDALEKRPRGRKAADVEVVDNPDVARLIDEVEARRAEALEALRVEFPPSSIGKLPRVICKDCSAKKTACDKHSMAECSVCGAWMTTKHIHLDYVGHAEVTDRLLSVDLRWNWEPVAWDDDGLPQFTRSKAGHAVGLWIRLTVVDVTRLGFGSVADATFEAEKQLIGDAIRNAAMRFGVALGLWSKNELESLSDPPAPSPTETAAPEDRDGWFIEHGWEGETAFLEWRERTVETLRGLATGQQQAFKAWREAHGLDFGKPWPYTDSKAATRYIESIQKQSSPTGSTSPAGGDAGEGGGEATANSAPSTPALDEASIGKMTLAEVFARLQLLGLSTEGEGSELRARLVEAAAGTAA